MRLKWQRADAYGGVSLFRDRWALWNGFDGYLEFEGQQAIANPLE
jgi:hypothetical protein